jgi:hypothetical protein
MPHPVNILRAGAEPVCGGEGETWIVEARMMRDAEQAKE